MADRYALRIPAEVHQQLDRELLGAHAADGSLAPDIQTELDRLAADPRLGIRVQAGLVVQGPLLYTFDVFRPGARFSVVVNYRFEANETHLLITRVKAYPR